MLKGYKTIIANAAMSIIPLLGLTEVAAIIPAEYMNYYMLFMVLANMWLRKVTTTAMGSAE